MRSKLVLLILLLLSTPVMAAQQVLDKSTTFPPGFTHGDYRNLIDADIDKINANDTELYRLAHDSYSSLQEYDDGDVVTSSHVLYVSLQDNNTGHPVTDPAWWQEVQTGGGTAPVDSVFGRTGAVTAQASDYSAYYLALAACSAVGEVPTWNGYAFVCSTPAGSGDMTKATYDTGDNGIVDNADALLGGTWAAPGADIGSSTPVAVTGTTATFDTYTTSAVDGSRYQLIWNTNDPSITCDADNNGAFAYRRSDNSFRYCNGSAWLPWPGGSGSSANIVDTDPTSSSPTGEYWSRASGDLFYVVNDGGANDGIFQVAGTWTPDAVTYTLTVTDPGNGDSITCSDSDLSTAINCGNGNSDCSATASSGANITGMTATAASGRQFDNWTGDITGSENPTTTALVMDSNKSVGAVFSATTSSTPDYQWNLDDNAANTTVLATYGSNASSLDSLNTGTIHSTDCLEGTGCFDYSLASAGAHRIYGSIDNAGYEDDTYTVQVSYKIPTTATFDQYTRVFSLDGNNVLLVLAQDPTKLSVYFRGNNLGTATISTVATGAWQVLRVVFDNGAARIYQGTSESSLSISDTLNATFGTGTNETSFNAYGSSTADQTFQYLGAAVDQIKIWNDAVNP